jgi:hypothetical protein
MISRPFFLLALLVLFLSLTFSSAHAQLRASIQGLITAQQGAVVQNATINLTKATMEYLHFRCSSSEPLLND